MVMHTVAAQNQKKLLVKPDFLATLNHTPTLQPRIEYAFSRKHSIQFTPGFCYGALYRFSVDYDGEYDLNNLIGFNARLEYRYYLDSHITIFKGLYAAPEFLYKSVWYNKGKYFLVHTPDVSYQRMLEYRVNRTVYAYHIKIGYQEKLSERVYIDIFAGIGRRIISIKNNLKIPEDATHISSFGSVEDFYEWDDYGTKTRISITSSILLGFLF
ncbi:MAG: DUF3575 domain-containing protein [Bacteroidia bacterium]|nr:DUF3575 domain-containing protein [Bacteroidia bacterium]